ncbi:hypothetical protein GGI18_004091, partial [Coemansia linderi]
MHPHYKAKIGGVGVNSLANRVATGQTTFVLAAKELGVSRFALAARMRSLKEKVFSPRWTEEETRKLTEYVRGCDSKPDMAYFSKVFGTK